MFHHIPWDIVYFWNTWPTSSKNEVNFMELSTLVKSLDKTQGWFLPTIFLVFIATFWCYLQPTLTVDYIHSISGMSKENQSKYVISIPLH